MAQNRSSPSTSQFICHIMIRMLVLWSLHGDFRTSAEFSYLEFDLSKDVETSTEANCELKRRSVKHNQSSQFSNDSLDDCIVYSDTCPEEVKISWLQMPPFVYDSADNNHSMNEVKLNGVFRDIFLRAMNVCCGDFAGTIPKVRVLVRANHLRDLHRQILRGPADVILPVQSDEAKYGGSLPYIRILDSPGVVLIQQRASSWAAATGLRSMWKAVLGTWPVVVLALSLSCLAGILIWLMESWQNSKQFPRQVHRGTFEGFWWAVVTMSTVGYGDNTPKSVFGKLFAVVWILIGVTICSVMTASLSNALTSVTIQSYDVTTGIKIGVLRDSVAFQDAVNLAASVKGFSNHDDLYDSLLTGSVIDGVVEEIFTGIELLKMKDRSKYLTVSKFIQHNRGHGIAHRNNLFTEPVSACLSSIIKVHSNDVISLTSKYMKASENGYNKGKGEEEELRDATVFDSQLPFFKGILIACLVSMVIVLGFGVAHLVVAKHTHPEREDSSNTSQTRSLGDDFKLPVCRMQTDV